jgi:peptide/nickel transport system substrate-binding protein
MASFEMVMSDGTTRSYLDALYDEIIGDDDNTGLPNTESGWATSWEVSADGLTWTIKGRDTIAFHDGHIVDSGDVKFGIDRMLAEGYRGTGGTSVKREVDSMETPDPNTFIAHLKAKAIFWHASALTAGNGSSPTYIIPAHYIGEVGEGVANKTPLGSGPYKAVVVAVNERIEYEAVEKHWFLGTPNVKTLNYLVIPEESTRVALLRTGGVDIATIGKGSGDTVRDAGLQVFNRTTSGFGAYRIEEQFKESYEGYGPNPFADIRVRRALDWYAIDRQVMVDIFLFGLGTPTMSYPIGPTDPAYVPLPIPQYDPDRARALLAEAGWGDGFEIDFIIVPRPAIPEGEEIAEAMAGWYEDLGITVNRVPTQYSAFRAQLLGEGFTRPTVFGVWQLGTRSVSGARIGARHDPGAGFANSYDLKMADLAHAWQEVNNVEEYITAGRAYQQEWYDQVGTSVLFLTGEVFGASSKIPSDWNVRARPYSFNLEGAGGYTK